MIHYHYSFTVATDLVTALENGLDFTHAGFVHARTFRSIPSQLVRVDIRETTDFVEFGFVGEPKPNGLLFSILDTTGTPFAHIDRFYPPSMIETVYSYGDKVGLHFREVMTPLDQDRTAVFGCLVARPRPMIPHFLSGWLLRSQGNKIIAQDQHILKLIHQNRAALNGQAKPGIIRSDLYRRYIESRIEPRSTILDPNDVHSVEVLL